MLFSYKAKSKNGEIIEGVMESPDRFSLARELRSRGDTPISIREKNKNPFETTKNHRWYEFNISELKSLDKEILKMIEDFCVVEKNGSVLISEAGLNGMDISFFLNHSKNPNVKTIDEGFSFLTLREIKKNEEIKVSYGTYDWKYK